MELDILTKVLIVITSIYGIGEIILLRFSSIPAERRSLSTGIAAMLAALAHAMMYIDSPVYRTLPFMAIMALVTFTLVIFSRIYFARKYMEYMKRRR